MEYNVLQQLAELRKLYQNNRVSVMVGAGFSKNACPDFPSWNELLRDMIKDMYQSEIEAAYLRYLKLSPNSKMSLDVFKQEEADRIINKKGPLNLVSEYISRKGFRESIEYYIEERIPYIDEANSEFRYRGINEGKRIKVNPDYLKAHIKLIEGQHWIRRYTTNYDRLLEYASRSATKTLIPITRAKDLSVFKDDPDLIKLHGDLYLPDNKKDRVFRFDGNPHQQYIISAEDYKNYPKEHEAFTQLMRISLLQGVFCLIGFSGDDPNFVNWIEWVRDILERDNYQDEEGREEKRGKEYKIYLIDVSKKLPSQEKLLFYENHNIFYIPIKREDVLNEIGASASEEMRDVFCHFFDYIEPEEFPHYEQSTSDTEPQPVAPTDAIGVVQDDTEKGKEAYANQTGDKTPKENEQIKSNDYLSLWGQVYQINHSGTLQDFSYTISVDDDVLDKLEQIKIWNRFVNNSDQQKRYLGEIRHKQKLTDSEARLAILAIRDTGISVEKDIYRIISDSGISDEYLAEFNKLVHRADSLCNEWDEEEPVDHYEQILRSLWHLDFSGVKKLLKEWSPKGPDTIKKAVLLYFFGLEGAKDLLINYLKDEVNSKERYYATRLLNVVEGVFPQKHSLAKFENANIQDYARVQSNYIRRVEDNKEKIVRYGDGKNEKILYLDGYKPNKLAESMAVLNFMIEAPSFPSYRNFFTNVSAENWYPVHKNLFERFPFAILFYDISCQDKKVRSRIGQDFAYSDHLKETCLDKLLENLLRALLSEDTPFYLIEAILTISKEFFVSVPSSKWEQLFLQIWEKYVIRRRIDNKDDMINDVLDTFMYRGLNSLKNTDIRQRVIVDVLKDAKKDTGFAINCLYYMHVVKGDGVNNEELTRAVTEFCSNIDKPEEITIAGNIHRLLDKGQIELASQKCVMMLRNSSGNSIERVVYQSAQFFVKDNPEKRKIFVESVCNSPLLWKSGITPEGHYTSFTYLKLTSFIRRIYIDKETLFIIYERLKDSLDAIVRFGEKHKSFPFLGDLDGLLSEMLSFMNYFMNRLAIAPDYYKVYNTAQRIMREISGVNNIEDGLLSQYEEELKKALSFIYKNRDSLTHKDIVRYANIVINRALMQNSDGLDTCIGYLRLYMEEGLIGKDDEALMEEVVNILNRYNKDTAQECNMNLVMTTQDMSKIGKILKKFGYKSEGIDYWIKLQNSGRFVTNF